jgi:NAD(P)-dependent dehydrogenase (short-subunit alcohol dehydrogenase family)
MELQGKTALVTGGARRVGKAISLALARRGANVVVNYHRSEEEARQTVEEITALGPRGLAVRADVTRADDVKAMVQTALDCFGRLEVLVNNAAVFFKTPFDTLTEPDWDLTVDSNLKGPFLCALFVGQQMIKQGTPGKIINIGDWSGIRPYVDYIPYCVSKAGVIALTKALAVTLAPTIQVNCVAPGPVLMPEDYGEEEREEIIAGTPLKRFGSPEDVANTVIFLVEGSDFVTGATYLVDGGRLLA